MVYQPANCSAANVILEGMERKQLRDSLGHLVGLVMMKEKSRVLEYVLPSGSFRTFLVFFFLAEALYMFLSASLQGVHRYSVFFR